MRIVSILPEFITGLLLFVTGMISAAAAIAICSIFKTTLNRLCKSLPSRPLFSTTALFHHPMPHPASFSRPSPSCLPPTAAPPVRASAAPSRAESHPPPSSRSLQNRPELRPPAPYPPRTSLARRQNTRAAPAERAWRGAAAGRRGAGRQRCGVSAPQRVRCVHALE